MHKAKADQSTTVPFHTFFSSSYMTSSMLGRCSGSETQQRCMSAQHSSLRPLMRISSPAGLRGR
jgi:hypothetical protein